MSVYDGKEAVGRKRPTMRDSDISQIGGIDARGARAIHLSVARTQGARPSVRAVEMRLLGHRGGGTYRSFLSPVQDSDR